MPATGTRIYLEIGDAKVFAVAVDWPGWSRAGKSESLAIETLAAYGPRYAVVARRAGLPFPDDAGEFDVVEKVRGGSATNFGVPYETAEIDRRPVSGPDAERLAALVAACWDVFDDVARAAPEELRKGPRGGGRDRTKIVDHVNGADTEYARKIGLRHKATDAAAVDAMRRDVLATLRRPSDGSPLAERGWTARYAARRIAWHTLDHTWEIEDRSEPA